MPTPNVLIIHTDQQRYDAVSAHGNDEIRTPNVDRLVEEGISFERYFVQNPVCMPSRASYLTGQYPSQLGIFNNGVAVPRDARTLPRLLANRDYHAANVGKLHFQPHANRDHREPHPDYGFDHLEVSDVPGLYEDAYRAWVRGKDPEQVDRISVGLNPGAKLWRTLMEVDDEVAHPRRDTDDVGDVSLDVDREGKTDPALPDVDADGPIPHPGDEDLTHPAFVADRTIDYLERHRDDRFCCVAGFWAPHLPYIVPQRFIDLYDPEQLSVPEYPPEVEAEREDTAYTDEMLREKRHGYYAAVSEVDYHVGRILDRLDELGLADDTIVVFTSDHGEYLGEHLRSGKGFPAEDAVSRVPCVVRWPAGVDDPGRRVSGIAEAVDLVPTLLDCCDVPRPRHLKGRSLRPALENEAFEGRDSALTEGGARENEGKSLRTERFRYVFRADGEEQLFDLDREFGEYRDVADDPEYADDLAAMRHELLVRMYGTDDALPRDYVY